MQTGSPHIRGLSRWFCGICRFFVEIVYSDEIDPCMWSVIFWTVLNKYDPSEIGESLWWDLHGYCRSKNGRCDHLDEVSSIIVSGERHYASCHAAFLIRTFPLWTCVLFNESFQWSVKFAGPWESNLYGFKGSRPVEFYNTNWNGKIDVQ